MPLGLSIVIYVLRVPFSIRIKYPAGNWELELELEASLKLKDRTDAPQPFLLLFS